MIENNKNNILFNINKENILYSLLISISFLFLTNYLIQLIAILVIAAIIYKINIETLLAVIIISLLTIVSDINADIRKIVQIGSLSILIYLYLSYVGFQIKINLPRSVNYFFVLLYSVVIISTFQSNHFYDGLNEIVKMSIFFLIVYILFTLIKNEKYVKYYLYALIITAVIMSISTLYNLYISQAVIFDFSVKSYTRISGLVSNMNSIAGFYAISIPILYALFYQTNIKRNKLIIIFALFAIIVGLLLSLSRASILSVIISTAFFLYIVDKKVLKQLFLCLFFIIIIIFSLKDFSEIIAVIFRFEDGLSQRDHLWQISMEMFKDNPIFGIGPGSYKYEMFNYFPVMLDSWRGIVLIDLHHITQGSNLSHSYYLFLMSDLGVFGLLVAIALPIVFIRIGMKSMNIYKNDYNKYILLTALTSIGIGLFIRGFFEGIGLLSYGWITNDLPFWIIFSVIIYYYNSSKINTETK